jgi:hypothetical protein
MRDSKNQMRLSSEQSLADGWTAATPLFSSLREENANESRHSDRLPMESWMQRPDRILSSKHDFFLFVVEI